MNNDNNHPQKQYLVSVVLASFWGFLGAKDWYNNNRPLAIVRLASTIVTFIMIILSMAAVLPGSIGSGLFTALAVWVLIDSVLTYQGIGPKIKQQKSMASATDKKFATFSIIISCVLTLILMAWSGSQLYGSLSSRLHEQRAMEEGVKDAEKFPAIQRGFTLEQVSEVMGREPICSDTTRTFNLASQTYINSMFCTYGKEAGTGISFGGADANYRSHSITLVFQKYEGEQYRDEFTLHSKEIQQNLIR